MLSSVQKHVNKWLTARIDVSALQAFIHKKAVPVHRHTIWYYFGGMTLFLFIVQATTGILLLLYYRPSAENAFESVQFIMTQVHFGWLIRSVHSWAANLLIFIAAVHMFSVLFLKAYRYPREMTWFSGMVLFFIFLGFGFSGYLLPWNEISFFATRVGTDIAGQLPVIGDFLARFLRGGEDITGGTLTRFYGFHVAVLPSITTFLLVFHLLLVQKQGMSIPLSIRKQVPEMPFIPHFLLRDILGWLLIIAGLAALSALFPWELGQKVDPFAAAPPGIMPEWYFVAMFQTLKFVPAMIAGIPGEQVAIISFGILAGLWTMIPVLDKKSSRGVPNSIVTALGIVVVVAIVVLTLYAYLWG